MNTGRIELRVGVGLERMGRDADAARRRGVEALGFGGFSSGGFVAKVRQAIAALDIEETVHGARIILDLVERDERRLFLRTFI